MFDTESSGVMDNDALSVEREDVVEPTASRAGSVVDGERKDDWLMICSAERAAAAAVWDMCVDAVRTEEFLFLFSCESVSTKWTLFINVVLKTSFKKMSLSAKLKLSKYSISLISLDDAMAQI